MGSITVYFETLHELGTTSYHHEFIVWTQDDGTQEIIRGGPRGLGNGGGSGSSGLNEPGSGTDIPFGSIEVVSGVYRNSNDYVKLGTDPGEVIAIGPDRQLGIDFQKMVLESDKINRENIGYAVGGPNSNSVVTTLLKSAGLPLPKGNGLNDPLAAPGANMSLEAGHYSAAEGYLELLENAAERGVRDIKRGVDDLTHDLSGRVDAPFAAVGAPNALVKRLRSTADAARAAYKAKQAAENAANPVLAMQRTLMAMATGNSLSVAPVPRPKPPQKASSKYSKHAAAGATLSPVRKVLEALPAGPSSFANIALAAAHAPAPKFMASGGNVSQALAPQPVAAILAEVNRRGGKYSLPTKGRPGSLVNELHLALKHRMSVASGIAGMAGSAQVFTGFSVRQRQTLPSIAPIGRRERDDISVQQLTSHFSDPPTPAEQKYSAPMVGAEKKIDPRALRGALEDLLERQGRLPPSGASAFDPLLTPAWPGLQLPA